VINPHCERSSKWKVKNILTATTQYQMTGPSYPSHLTSWPRCQRGRRALALGIAFLLILQAPVTLALSCIHSGQHQSAIASDTSVAETSGGETSVAESVETVESGASECHDAMPKPMPEMETANTGSGGSHGQGHETGVMTAMHPAMSGSSHSGSSHGDAMSEDCCSGECSCPHSVSFAIPLPDMASEVAVMAPHFAALMTAPSTRQESILHPPI